MKRLFILFIIILFFNMDKVFTQEIIQETPFPGEILPIGTPTPSQATGTYTPTISKDNNLPIKKSSTELLSTALNTRSKKILQEFELQQSGGLKIGDFKEGISGDLRITPNGITARDIAGITTFDINGDDGSATFRGIIEAADFQIIDKDGIISLANFQTKQVIATGFTTTGIVMADITGATLTFTIERPTHVLVFVNAMGKNDGFGVVAGNVGYIYLNVDGTLINSNHLFITGQPDHAGAIQPQFVSMTHLLELEAGTHTIKLQAILGGDTSNNFLVSQAILTYLVLGN